MFGIKTKKLAAVMIAAIFLAGMIGCSGNGSPEPEAGTGTLQVAFTAPDDVKSVSIALWEGATSQPYAMPDYNVTLNAGDPTFPGGDAAGPDAWTLFEGLHANDYWVAGSGYDTPGGFMGGGLEIYTGGDTIYVKRDQPNILNMVLNQKFENDEGHGAPRINGVTVTAGRIVLDTYLDPDASGELYVAAPDEGEDITFLASITEPDGDAYSTVWTVKDGPGALATDMGTVTVDSLDQMTWTAATLEGIYWVTLTVTDDAVVGANTAVASFQFTVVVSRGFGELQVTMEFNTFPTIELGAEINHGNLKDLSDTNVELAVLYENDPDGDAIPEGRAFWVHDCQFATFVMDDGAGNMIPCTWFNYPGQQCHYAPVVMLQPGGTEICSAFRYACDGDPGIVPPPAGNGLPTDNCNIAEVEMDLNCTTLANGFDTSAENTDNEPMNDCAIGCTPSLDFGEGDTCVDNGWDCGEGEDSCGKWKECGTCSGALPVCNVNNCVECIDAGDCGAGLWDCVANACVECVVDPADEAAACAAVECGITSAPDSCGGTQAVDCGSAACVDPTPVCGGNTCRPGEIYTCYAANYGQTSCLDLLEKDGWNLADAQITCTVSSADNPAMATATVVPEASSCKDSFGHLKRCGATVHCADCGPGDTLMPTPGGAEPYYLYANALPASVCTGNLLGTIDDCRPTITNPLPPFDTIPNPDQNCASFPAY